MHAAAGGLGWLNEAPAGMYGIQNQPPPSAGLLLLLLLPCPCRGQVPGFLGGFAAGSAGETDAEFDLLFERLTTEAFWCCFTWGDADSEYRQLPYQQPRPLAGGWAQAAGAAAAAAARNPLVFAFFISQQHGAGLRSTGTFVWVVPR